MTATIRLQQEPFDAAAEARALTRGRTDVGAVVTFTGICRGDEDGEPIAGLTLEHYPGMAEAEIARHVEAAEHRWSLRGITVIHRHGRIAPGEDIVLVVTASSHRHDAFAAAESPIAAQQPDEKFVSFAGQFLVATPSMEDPRFARTVILIARHNKDGAFGLIINRPAAERPLSQLLEALGEKGAPVNGTVRLFAGGPVQPELGFVIHSPDYHGPQTLEVDGRVSVTMSLDILRDIGAGKGPQKSLIEFGYAGWGSGQL